MNKYLNKWTIIKDGWNDRRSQLLEEEVMFPLREEACRFEEKEKEIMTFIHSVERELNQLSRRR